MRGFPPIQILLLTLAFALLALPLSHLTGTALFARHVESHEGHDHDEHGHDHDHDHDAHEAAGPKVVQGGMDHPEGEHVHEAVAARVLLRYAHKPLSVSLKQEGKELLKDIDLAESPSEVVAGIGISHDGNEMILTAKWPEGTPDTALTIDVEPDGFESRSITRWSSEAQLDEVITFQW